MKVITSPSVVLLAQPMFTEHPNYTLPNDGCAAERLIATAGKVCYDSYGLDGNPVVKHISTLISSGHHSVIEHVNVTVFVEGISRGCSHEIVRHRAGMSYSQRSTRYTEEGDAAIVLEPLYASLWERQDHGGTPLSNDEDELLSECLNSTEADFHSYTKTLGILPRLAPAGLTGRDLRKWCRGKARQLLPHALETRMVMTGNLRAWRHFFLMRTNRGAEAEIRRLAAAIWAIVEPIAPTVYADLLRGDVDGFVELTEA